MKEKIIIRKLRKADFSQVFEFINRGIGETDFMWRKSKITKKEQKLWFSYMLRDTKNKNSAMVVAEDAGKIIGNSTVNRNKSEVSSHVGDIGVIVLKNYWHQGIGTALMKKSEEIAKKELKLELLTLDVYSNNKAAQELYRKLGYRAFGCLPKAVKHGSKYQDKIYMSKVLR